jgi:hypothetical protein
LAVESHDLSQAEKKSAVVTSCTVYIGVHKTKTVFTQKSTFFTQENFECPFVKLLSLLQQ